MRLRHGALAMVGASFVMVMLSAAVPSAEGPGMQVIIDDRAVVFVGVSEFAAKELAETNGFTDPRDWPELGNTGHPGYDLPPGLGKRARKHPDWQLGRLGEFHVGFRDLGSYRMVLLYKQESHVLVLLYYELPKEEAPRHKK